MRIPLLLITLSSVFIIASCIPGSPFGATTFHFAALSAVAAFILLLIASFAEDDEQDKSPKVVVDGSNVMYWVDGKPDLSAVHFVVRDLRRQGLSPVVWFDANVGYMTKGRYLGPKDLANLIGLPSKQVFVAPRGTPADPLLLDGAKSLKARVVTNDRFRDWSASRPYLNAPGFLVRGQISQGEVRLAMH